MPKAPAGASAEYYIPQWEERTSYGMKRMDPYTKLFEDRIIFLGTPISDDIANAVTANGLDAGRFFFRAHASPSVST